MLKEIGGKVQSGTIFVACCFITVDFSRGLFRTSAFSTSIRDRSYFCDCVSVTVLDFRSHADQPTELTKNVSSIVLC